MITLIKELFSFFTFHENVAAYFCSVNDTNLGIACLNGTIFKRRSRIYMDMDGKSWKREKLFRSIGGTQSVMPLFIKTF